MTPAAGRRDGWWQPRSAPPVTCGLQEHREAVRASAHIGDLYGRAVIDRVDSLLLGGSEGSIRRPASPPTVGVLVLGGSSGRVEVSRCGLFAAHGALGVSIRWFAGRGQPSGICEIPLETFTHVIDAMVGEGVRKISLVGFSKGAEAALLVATLDPRVDAVVAISPSAYVWANVGPGFNGEVLPWRSSWTWRGRPLPFVPYDENWPEPQRRPVAYRTLYQQSLVAFADRLPAAAIPIEVTSAEVVLVAGEDDQMWPSADFARTLAGRRSVAGLPTELVVESGAGHRPILPGEAAPTPSADRAYGGSETADRALGAAAFPLALQAMGLTASG